MTPDALGWLRLLVSGTLDGGPVAREAVLAGWARATRRRDRVALVEAHRGDIEVRLDHTWPGWREAAERFERAGLVPGVSTWRSLSRRDRELPARLNVHNAAAWVTGDSKAWIDPRPGTVFTSDGVLRLRPSAGLSARRGGQTVTVLDELFLSERSILDGATVSGTLPSRLLLVENLGVYIDLALGNGDCAALVPGNDTRFVSFLLSQFSGVATVLFGDLDPAGHDIATRLRREWPGLEWFVPSLADEILEVSRPGAAWGNVEGEPPLVRELARRGRWVEQEALLGVGVVP